MGGGNTAHRRRGSAPGGLSPRGRGKLGIIQYDNANKGSIPAWAGETFYDTDRNPGPGVYPRVGGGNSPPARRRLTMTVYPRVGGGNRSGIAGGTVAAGLSPRGRGKRRADDLYPAQMRSIPAWAGETGRFMPSSAADWVYPRVGGGNPQVATEVGGAGGLSPRGRGKPPGCNRSRRGRRSIPAWAGETGGGGGPAVQGEVYPRVGGGNLIPAVKDVGYHGLSPRGRGKHAGPSPFIRQQGSIPAWAGETPILPMPCPATAVYPRVGGGNYGRQLALLRPDGLSPRGRGKHRAALPAGEVLRSIPAWAGETCFSIPFLRVKKVYPRVGGGNQCGNYRRRYFQGLSPRGRGKRGFRRRVREGLRSIPAWAGETSTSSVRPRMRPVYPRVGGGNAIPRQEEPLSGGLSPRGRGKP